LAVAPALIAYMLHYTVANIRQIGVGLLLYLLQWYAKTKEQDKADTILTPFSSLNFNRFNGG